MKMINFQVDVHMENVRYKLTSVRQMFGNSVSKDV